MSPMAFPSSFSFQVSKLTWKHLQFSRTGRTGAVFFLSENLKENKTKALASLLLWGEHCTSTAESKIGCGGRTDARNEQSVFPSKSPVVVSH